jgi:hypothetical protein
VVRVSLPRIVCRERPQLAPRRFGRRSVAGSSVVRRYGSFPRAHPLEPLRPVLRAVRRHPGGSESGLGCGGPASLGRGAFSYTPRTCPTIAGCRGGRTPLLFPLLFVDLSVPSSPCNFPVLPQEFLRVFHRAKAKKAAGRTKLGHLSGSSSFVSRTRSMLRGCNPISPIHPSIWKGSSANFVSARLPIKRSSWSASTRNQC